MLLLCVSYYFRFHWRIKDEHDVLQEVKIQGPGSQTFMQRYRHTPINLTQDTALITVIEESRDMEI